MSEAQRNVELMWLTGRLAPDFKTIANFRKDAAEITPVLRDIEERLSRYIPIGANGHATKLHVSELTRDHLRKTMAFFLALAPDQDHVPFAHAGTGTLNTLVLALLTVIAEMKPESVIFAMEEPEIAVPLHTQRRITHYPRKRPRKPS